MADERNGREVSNVWQAWEEDRIGKQRARQALEAMVRRRAARGEPYVWLPCGCVLMPRPVTGVRDWRVSAWGNCRFELPGLIRYRSLWHERLIQEFAPDGGVHHRDQASRR